VCFKGFIVKVLLIPLSCIWLGAAESSDTLSFWSDEPVRHLESPSTLPLDRNSSSPSIEAVVRPVTTFSPEHLRSFSVDPISSNKSNQSLVSESLEDHWNGITTPIGSIVDASPTVDASPPTTESSNSSSTVGSTRTAPDVTYSEYILQSLPPSLRANQYVTNRSADVTPFAFDSFASQSPIVSRNSLTINSQGNSVDAPSTTSGWTGTVSRPVTSSPTHVSYGKTSSKSLTNSFLKKYRSPKENLSFGRTLSASLANLPDYQNSIQSSVSGGAFDETPESEMTLNHNVKSFDQSIMMEGDRPSLSSLALPRFDASNLMTRRPLIRSASWPANLYQEPMMMTHQYPPMLVPPAVPEPWYPPARQCCWTTVPKPTPSVARPWSSRSLLSMYNPLRSATPLRFPSFIWALADGATRYAAELSRMRFPPPSAPHSPPLSSSASPSYASLPSSLYSSPSFPLVNPYFTSDHSSPPISSAYRPILYNSMMAPYPIAPSAMLSYRPVLINRPEMIVQHQPDDTQLQQFKI
jgi:hypothetical protein